jgi:hypothetical protein
MGLQGSCSGVSYVSVCWTYAEDFYLIAVNIIFVFCKSLRGNPAIEMKLSRRAFMIASIRPSKKVWYLGTLISASDVYKLKQKDEIVRESYECQKRSMTPGAGERNPWPDRFPISISNFEGGGPGEICS